MNIFTFLTPVTYWILILIWSFILIFYIKRLMSDHIKGQLISILLMILAVDAFRTLFESVYFGAWYTSLAGFLPKHIHTILVRPELVFIPKILNVIAAIIVVILLIFKWLPKEVQEKDKQEKLIKSGKAKLKKTYNELLKSEERFKLAMEANKDGLWDWKVETGDVYFSPGYVAMLGYKISDFPPHINSWEDLLHQDDKDRAIKNCMECIENRCNHFRIEFRMKGKNNEWYWILGQGKVVERDETGRAVRIVGTHTDITERKLSEEAIRKNESIQRKMVANIGDVIVIIDKNGINKYKSANIEKWFGWKPEDVVGFSTWETIHPDDLDPTRDFFEKIMSKPNKAGTTECRYRCKDGSYKWIKFTGTNLIHDPEINGILGNYHDITERKGAEKSLQESEARFKALHNASFGGIVIHDKGVILDCNKGLSDMTGYTFAELVGMDGLLLIAEKSRDLVMGNIVSGYEKPYEATGLHKDGGEFPMRLEARNIPYQGKSIRAVEFRDITDQKLAEKERQKLQNQLIQAQKMESVGRLAGGVAHDFNNMLSVIHGNTEMIIEDIDQNHSVIPMLHEVQKATERSSNLTHQLLAFARKQTIAPRILNLNETIKGMFKMLRRLIGEDIDLSWLPKRNLWPVKIDPSQVDQILANLAINARDSIKDVGKITIETDNVHFDHDYCLNHTGFIPGDYVVIAVSDNGNGMDKETVNNIFEPFFTTKELGKGTGLGLSTIYGIVKQNNGFINVYSELREGTTFKIYLPPHDKRIKNKEQIKPEINTTGGHETILLVEDETAILKTTKMMLERLGYKVFTASTPGEAIKICNNSEPGEIHLLMTDVVMPEMNGRDLNHELTQSYPDLKCLFMSGYTANVIAHHGILDEGLNFINKPFSKLELSDTLRGILDDKPS